MNTTFFNNKKCLITGAASGIGKATALMLAEYDTILFLTDINEKGLQETTELIKQKKGVVKVSKAFNISNFKEVNLFAEEINKQYGAMDMIMNIAGISAWGAIDQMEYEEWNKIIDINLKGPIQLIQSFIPEMIKEKKGHIVNVSSAAGLFGLPWHGVYSASKYGLRGLSDVLRHDLKRHNITTHLVCPGAVDTGLVHSINISGVTIPQEELLVLKTRFQKHAVKPDEAAKKILKGIRKNKYLIYTSFDIRFAYWVQRKFTFIYIWVMQKMNDYFQNKLTGK